MTFTVTLSEVKMHVHLERIHIPHTMPNFLSMVQGLHVLKESLRYVYTVYVYKKIALLYVCILAHKFKFHYGTVKYLCNEYIMYNGHAALLHITLPPTRSTHTKYCFISSTSLHPLRPRVHCVGTFPGRTALVRMETREKHVMQ